jgi:hypothetical protein
MSATDPPPGDQARRPPPPVASSGWTMVGRVLAVLAGVILLLPGVCALGFAISEGSDGFEPLLMVLWLICFAIAFGGGTLIWFALRPRRGG